MVRQWRCSVLKRHVLIIDVTGQGVSDFCTLGCLHLAMWEPRK